MKLLLIVPLLVAAALVPQDEIRPTDPVDHHEWLLGLVGDWKVEVETPGSSEAAFTEFETTESVSAIGKLWVVVEGAAEFGGTPFRSMMTLGYDTEREIFVGSYVDSMQTFMWSYTGRLEDEGKALVLDTKGPAMTGSGEMSNYRERIEMVDEDHRVFTSSYEGEDGEWVTFMRSEARRVE
ncbi:MAG: DUF1579 domain-containing protein [Planctomycetota bacterium]